MKGDSFVDQCVGIDAKGYGWGFYRPAAGYFRRTKPRLNDFISRLSALISIKDIDLHVDEVTGTDKSLDIVVDIFNRVNSGGTKLSKGGLGAGQNMRRLAGGTG